MKKSLCILFIIFLLSAGHTIFVSAQELGDVEVVTKKLENIYQSKYGYVVDYATSDLYRETLYIPREWFLRVKNQNGEKKHSVVGDQKNMYLNVSVPLLKATYIDTKLKYVTMLIPVEYSRTIFPPYEGPLNDENLKAKFDEQLSQDSLILK